MYIKLNIHNTHSYILTATSYRQWFVCKWFISITSHASSRCRPISVHYISLRAPSPHTKPHSTVVTWCQCPDTACSILGQRQLATTLAKATDSDFGPAKVPDSRSGIRAGAGHVPVYCSWSRDLYAASGLWTCTHDLSTRVWYRPKCYHRASLLLHAYSASIQYRG